MDLVRVGQQASPGQKHTQKGPLSLNMHRTIDAGAR